MQHRSERTLKESKKYKKREKEIKENAGGKYKDLEMLKGSKIEEKLSKGNKKRWRVVTPHGRDSSFRLLCRKNSQKKWLNSVNRKPEIKTILFSFKSFIFILMCIYQFFFYMGKLHKHLWKDKKN